LPEEWIIRAAKPDDAPELARLRYEFRTERREPVEAAAEFLRRCAEWMGPRLQSDSAWRCWVAEAGGRLLGTLWLQLIEKIPNPVAERELHGYISSVYVIPQRRRAGIGSALLDTCLRECDRMEFDVVFLWSTPRSRVLYQRKGFAMRADLLDRRSTRREARES
jgi:GNAT superfamily N-acetyltransferase